MSSGTYLSRIARIGCSRAVAQVLLREVSLRAASSFDCDVSCTGYSRPDSKFANPCGSPSCELRNQRDTSKTMILVPRLNPKFAIKLAATICELWVRGTSRPLRGAAIRPSARRKCKRQSACWVSPHGASRARHAGRRRSRRPTSAQRFRAAAGSRPDCPAWPPD